MREGEREVEVKVEGGRGRRRDGVINGRWQIELEEEEADGRRRTRRWRRDGGGGRRDASECSKRVGKKR